jgi:hypothetical protein
MVSQNIIQEVPQSLLKTNNKSPDAYLLRPR